MDRNSVILLMTVTLIVVSTVCYLVAARRKQAPQPGPHSLASQASKPISTVLSDQSESQKLLDGGLDE